MATMLVLFETGATDVTVDPAAIDALAAIGVTHLTLVRDEHGVGVVLEGWAFDAAASTDAVLSALSAGDGAARALASLGEMALSTTQQKGVVLR
jgi:hypothetical protein